MTVSEGEGSGSQEQGRMDQGPVLEKDPMVRAATLPMQEGVSRPISSAAFLDTAVSKTEGGNSSRPMTGATRPARLHGLTRSKM